MSDFPELEDFSNVAASNDPQADFLARERALLGDEFGAPPENYQETIQVKQDDDDQFGLGDFSSAPIDHHPQPAAPPPVSTTGAPDELASFQDQYPDISHDIPDQTNGFDAPAPSLYANQSSAYATPAVYAQTQTEEESPFIKEWRTNQAEEIRVRDERSAAKREETIVAAEKAIDEFYHGYNTEKQKNIAKNKEEEAKFIQSRSDKLAQGTTWERIAELIELQDSRSKTCGKSAKDLARFKEILLNLKRDGQNAPGAAGF
ncbi:hypothetical protein PGT21_023910 [Puccinia graminis f. sp. tritici]|uniref:Clathrin light chain n=2 Tax=Puccinia graminis f. sp. tritici TaxID=56615 RepID=E3K2I6_PUCGT|nr:uncharacterized protein PGTG_04511 [Puccinia graminis f. sp. tritici CRL 75-36-700-3]EFP78555.1 hypothetical protein PGTG_04511 [Puccinia graminis f. sp. tritici CRL 75-36-700-3]KAA1078771.1 hypothetical protein PGTUg99_013147 [Puccinia graminis f. sp. tritici]KAA1119382.1 hypothetical protein PGT21_023910 [Puccinia graminis f. sp. tritici]